MEKLKIVLNPEYEYMDSRFFSPGVLETIFWVHKKIHNPKIGYIHHIGYQCSNSTEYDFMTGFLFGTNESTAAADHRFEFFCNGRRVSLLRLKIPIQFFSYHDSEQRHLFSVRYFEIKDMTNDSPRYAYIDHCGIVLRKDISVPIVKQELGRLKERDPKDCPGVENKPIPKKWTFFRPYNDRFLGVEIISKEEQKKFT